jgi:hypothetical protein
LAKPNFQYEKRQKELAKKKKKEEKLHRKAETKEQNLPAEDDQAPSTVVDDGATPDGQE